MSSQTGFRRLQWGAMLLGVLLLAMWSGTFFESFGYQAFESKRLEAASREADSRTTSVTPAPTEVAGPREARLLVRARERGQVLGQIEIPRLGIRAIVAEGTDVGTLRRAVGHVASSALPGQPGNCALAGHRDTFFRGLGNVRETDIILVETPESTLTYQVQWSVVVEPRRVDLLDSTDARALTLVTCYPFEFVGRAPRRFVVRALQVDPLVGLSAGSPDDEPGSGSGPRH